MFFVFVLDCTIGVNDPFKPKQPLLTNSNFKNLLEPNTNDGRIVINQGSKIGVCCPSFCEKYTCVGAKDFTTEDDTDVDIVNDSICPDKFDVTIRPMNKTINGVGTWYSSGLEFGSSTTKRNFIELYRVLYNMTNSSPVVVVHKLTKANLKGQPNVQNPSTWFHRGFFGSIGNPNQLYSKDKSLSALVTQLGDRQLAEEYVDPSSASKFLARGHLAPRQDFVFAPAKLASCSLVSFL